MERILSSNHPSSRTDAERERLNDSITNDLPVKDETHRPLPPGPEEEPSPQTSRLKSRLEKLRNQVLPCVSRDVLERAYRVLDESDPEKVQVNNLSIFGMVCLTRFLV